MKPFMSGCLLIAAISLALAGCQSAPVEAPPAPPSAVELLQQSITGNELATAEDQLAALQAKTPNDPQLENLQRQLAEAYLKRSQIVLQKGDVNAAATALARARSLMPQAPALVGGVNGAIAQARKAELEKAEAALKAAEAKPVARVIDPAANSTPITLATRDLRQLWAQLDDITTDIVNYHCDVVVQAPRQADIPWLETLIRSRVNRRAPGLQWKLGHRIEQRQPAMIILSPAKP